MGVGAKTSPRGLSGRPRGALAFPFAGCSRRQIRFELSSVLSPSHSATARARVSSAALLLFFIGNFPYPPGTSVPMSATGGGANAFAIPARIASASPSPPA